MKWKFWKKQPKKQPAWLYTEEDLKTIADALEATGLTKDNPTLHRLHKQLSQIIEKAKKGREDNG